MYFTVIPECVVDPGVCEHRRALNPSDVDFRPSLLSSSDTRNRPYSSLEQKQRSVLKYTSISHFTPRLASLLIYPSGLFSLHRVLIKILSEEDWSSPRNIQSLLISCFSRASGPRPPVCACAHANSDERLFIYLFIMYYF